MKREFSTTPGRLAELHRDGDWELPYYIPGRAQLGVDVHRHEQRTHGDWQAEVALKHTYHSRHGDRLVLSGRIDLLLKSDAQIRLKEVKSVVLTPSQFHSILNPPAHFSIQAQVYAYMMQHTSSIAADSIQPIVLCVNLNDGSQREWEVDWSVESVENMLEDFLKNKRLSEAIRLKDLRRRRRISRRITFPFPTIRPAQQIILESLESTLQEGGDAYIEATPGSGKTVAVLVPLLKNGLQKGVQVFFATAKGGGRSPVMKAARQLAEMSDELKIVFLEARESICKAARSNSVCQLCTPNGQFEVVGVEESSPDINRGGIFDTARFVAIAEKYDACAHHVAHSAAEQADLLVGDYNFIFDPGATLEFLKEDKPLNWYLAADEAHNLPERARENWSAEFSLSGFDRMWETIDDDLWRFGDRNETEELKNIATEIREWIESTIEAGIENAISEIDFEPAVIDKLLQKLEIQAGRFLAFAGGRLDPDALGSLYEMLSGLQQFSQALGLRDEARVGFVDRVNNLIGVKCIDPSEKIAEVCNRLQGAVFFSGTLSPIDRFRLETGQLQRRFSEIIVADQLPEEHRLLVVRVAGISTKKKVRTKTSRKVARVISDFSARSPGSVLAIFPSYDYLGEVAVFLNDHRSVVLRQSPNMNHEERREFKDRLAKGGRNTVGMVVAGGQFSEAEDYPGEACVGVVVVGPCLPPPDPWREKLSEYWDNMGENGIESAYIIPAVRKVVQAAGRLIRHDDDRGVVLLIDERFARNPVYSLLPAHWRRMIDRQEIGWEASVREFWENHS